MRTLRSGLGVTMLLLALAGTASAQSAPPEDVFAGRLPDVVAGEPLYRVPTEIEDPMRATFVRGFTELLDPWSSRVDIDLATSPAAIVTNLDFQFYLDAQAAGTFTEGDGAALETWESTEVLMVVALYLGDGVADELLDAMVADTGLDDMTAAGRRIVEVPPPGGSGGAWGAAVSDDDILYIVMSMDDEPTLLQTVADIPVPEE